MIFDDIYKIAASYVSEKPQKSEIKKLCLVWVKPILEECLAYENAYRKNNDINELKSAPTISDFGDNIDFCDMICTLAIPYKLASLLFSNDEEDYKSAVYENKYADALQSYTSAVDEQCADLY